MFMMDVPPPEDTKPQTVIERIVSKEDTTSKEDGSNCHTGYFLPQSSSNRVWTTRITYRQLTEITRRLGGSRI